MRIKKQQRSTSVNPWIVFGIGVVLWIIGRLMDSIIGDFIALSAYIFVPASIIQLIINAVRKRANNRKKVDVLHEQKSEQAKFRSEELSVGDDHEDSDTFSYILIAALFVVWFLASLSIWLNIPETSAAIVFTIMLGAVATIIGLVITHFKDSSRTYRYLEQNKTWRLTKVIFIIGYIVLALILSMVFSASPMPLIVSVILFYPSLVLVRRIFVYVVGQKDDEATNEYNS